MEEQKKISVVINTYNAEPFLAQVLEAVKDFDETVVCDMESTDNTVEIEIPVSEETAPTYKEAKGDLKEDIKEKEAEKPWYKRWFGK